MLSSCVLISYNKLLRVCLMVVGRGYKSWVVGVGVSVGVGVGND